MSIDHQGKWSSFSFISCTFCLWEGLALKFFKILFVCLFGLILFPFLISHFSNQSTCLYALQFHQAGMKGIGNSFYKGFQLKNSPAEHLIIISVSCMDPLFSCTIIGIPFLCTKGQIWGKHISSTPVSLHCLIWCIGLECLGPRKACLSQT